MFGDYRIIRNAIRCKKCGDVIESKTFHDFKWCKCHSCAVDGGHDYLRRVGDCDVWEDLSECIPTTNKYPGMYIKEALEEWGMSVKEFSKQANIHYEEAVEIISGKKRLTKRLAKKIGDFFNTSSEGWLKLQEKCDMRNSVNDKT